jgi:molybdopterin-guanine dinucleotide biosynthesis protein A
MGMDKAFLKIEGLPMVERVILTLRTVVDHIIVVTNSPEAYVNQDVEVATDVGDGRGSLIGLYSGLLRSRHAYNVVVACDMPYLNPRLIQYMTGLTGDYDVILPKIGAFVEPLHAVYHKSLLPVMKAHIERDQRQIRSIFTGQRIRYITEEEIDRFDPMRRSFKNINTRQEYEEVSCSDLECRS